MPKTITLANLRLACQRRADMENDAHISTAEWATLINEQYGDLYSIIAQSGSRFFETIEAVVATGAISYSEPIDHYATVGIDHVLDNAGRRTSLTEAMTQERQYMAGTTGTARYYAHVADQLYLYPNPPSGTYEWFYIPQSPDLTAYSDGQSINMVTPDGEAFMVWGVAVKALAKAERDASLAMAEREAARGRLEQWAALKVFNSTRRPLVEEDEYDQGYGIDWRFL